MSIDKLTVKQAAFYTAMLECGNATEAYRRAYNTSKMKPESVTNAAHHLLKHPKIAAMLSAGKKKAEEAAIFGIAEVMRDWFDIHRADPDKLTRIRRICCRHCHGVDHAYQWKDKAEHSRAVANAIDENAMRANMKPKKSPLPMPSESGGYGFRFNMDPHPECPECLGEGKVDTFIADTSKLTGPEKKLYGGFKQTKDGLTIVMRDQDGALANIAKALGMMVEKVKPVDPDTKDMPALPLDAQEASRQYQQWVKGD